MGLPEISITFSNKAASAVKRSEQGTVLLLLKEAKNLSVTKIVEYKNIEKVTKADWTAENLEYINQAFKGYPQKVICVSMASTDEIEDVLLKVKNIKFNYLAYPDAETLDVTAITDWVKRLRKTEEKTVKAVLSGAKADNEGIINFTTKNIVVGAKTYTAGQYTARIAGLLAGLPFTQSATYQVLEEVEGIEEKEDANEAIDAGELILIFDGEKYKIGRGVNSLTTVSQDQSADWKKIKIIEIYDMIRNDIYSTFEDDYVGKVPNTYDNQLLFINTVNRYFKGLMQDEVLDPSAINESYVDVEAQRRAWDDSGVDTSILDDEAIKTKSFSSNLFLAGTIKAVDAMEDLVFKIEA